MARPQPPRPRWTHLCCHSASHAGTHLCHGPLSTQRRLTSKQPLRTRAPSVTEYTPVGRRQVFPRGPCLPGVGGWYSPESQGTSIILMSCKPHGVSHTTRRFQISEMAAVGPEQVVLPRSLALSHSLPPTLGGHWAFARLLLLLGCQPCSSAVSAWAPGPSCHLF